MPGFVCKGFMLAGMLSICLAAVGCSPAEEERGEETIEKKVDEKVDEKPEVKAPEKTEVSFTRETAVQHIEQVTRLELTGPDKKYQELMQAVMEGVDNTAVEQQENIMIYKAYVKQVYGPFFTEDALNQFISAGAFQYDFFNDAVFEMKPVKLEVTQSDIQTADNQFTIDAVVEVSAPGLETEQFPVEGRAFISKKDGRIGVYQLGHIDSELRAHLLMLENR
ncbi:hypothetical protein NCCP2716_11930 [Sporosarcina sp. NCCP-2716]|uniref:hypothetical protein n=1 Tax=Sporosarcina sp. NCCP-2716 TaxID=2943679 RepID=UPI0020406684|nr:hypothetical protein [Sporosarcina sp. NCCP-2716]GKV68695.1 hypothetical protein NCCP2716_11930 [Sporosarcina sp. NCCP-2716]